MQTALRLLRIPFFSAALMLNTTASAQDAAKNLAGDLERECKLVDNTEAIKTFEDAADAGACIGYFDGLGDLNNIWGLFASGTEMYCVPKEGISVNDMRKVFLRAMERKPEMRSEKKRVVVISALGAAYPCKKK